MTAAGFWYHVDVPGCRGSAKLKEEANAKTTRVSADSYIVL